jgi:hypothetical protein
MSSKYNEFLKDLEKSTFKLDHVSELPGKLVKTQIARLHPQSF